MTDYKLCVDCAYGFYDYPEHQCVAPVVIETSLVDGMPRATLDGRLCRVARGDGERCGPDAKLFEPKVIAPSHWGVGLLFFVLSLCLSFMFFR